MPDSFTPEAEELLRQEIQRRGLASPDPVPESLAYQELAPAWVTIDRFRDLSSAIVARGALESAGIPCFLRDENTVRLDWQISNFIGGMRLQVEAQHEAAARAVLTELTAQDAMESDDEAALQPEEHCPFCGSSDIHPFEPTLGLRAAALWLFSLPMPKAGRKWRCHHCGRKFPEASLASGSNPGEP